MKKWIILFGILGLVLLFLIGFDGLDRIKIKKNGIGGYDLSDYNVFYREVDNVNLSINMSQYTGEKIMLYSEEGLSLYVQDIVYQGDYYWLLFETEGYGNFRYGKDFNFNKLNIRVTNDDCIIDIKQEEYIGNNKHRYTYYVLPNGKTSEEIASMVLDLCFENIIVEEYTRK